MKEESPQQMDRPARDGEVAEKIRLAAVAAGEAAKPDFDAPVRMRVCLCAECDMAFAVPVGFFLHAAQQGDTIRCPRGHVNAALEPADYATAGHSLGMQLALLEELATIRLHLASAERELAMLRPKRAGEATADDREVKRRILILVNRAEQDVYGKRLCPFCGKAKSHWVLKRHLWDGHKEDVRDLPASRFE